MDFDSLYHFVYPIKIYFDYDISCYNCYVYLYKRIYK